MMDYKLCRRLSGVMFLMGNFIMLFGNLGQTNWMQLVASPLFMSCSVALILSAKNHRWLFYCAGSSAIAYLLVAVSTDGDGNWLSYVGFVSALISCLLTLRAAMQRETGKQYSMPAPFSVMDDYPLTATGVTNGLCCLLTIVAAYFNHDSLLMGVELVWTIACGFMIASDEYLRSAITRSKGKDYGTL